MKRHIKVLLMILPVVAILLSCNKTKINSDRLIDGGEWKVTELTVDGVSEAELPEWEIKTCDIYAESCEGEWKNEEGGHAEFIWQFRNKGKSFEISRQAETGGEAGHTHNHAEEEAIAQCYAFSGVYDVDKRKKTSMSFTTNAALGHAGKQVVIKIEKK